MNLDELRSVQSKERQKDSLQHLRDSFYADVGQYVADLKAQRDRAAESADDPFSDPEVGRLTDEIETAEEVVEAVYERRMGKIVKRASLAAAGMPSDEEGLTTEEKELFGDIVDRIESNKALVLDTLSGEGDDADAPPGGATDAADPAPAETDGVSAADVMGGGDDAATGPTGDAAPAADAEPDDDSVPDPIAEAERHRAAGSGDEAPGEGQPASPTADDGGDVATAADGNGRQPAAEADGSGEGSSEPDRSTVRITQDVGEILGVDERAYELTAEDVVTLPEQNVGPLVQRDAAERLD